jgi:hypothetical protein
MWSVQSSDVRIVPYTLLLQLRVCANVTGLHKFGLQAMMREAPLALVSCNAGGRLSAQSAQSAARAASLAEFTPSFQTPQRPSDAQPPLARLASDSGTPQAAKAVDALARARQVLQSLESRRGAGVVVPPGKHARNATFDVADMSAIARGRQASGLAHTTTIGSALQARGLGPIQEQGELRASTGASGLRATAPLPAPVSGEHILLHASA